MKSGLTKKLRLEYIYRSQNAVITITMAVSDNCVGSETDVERLSELVNELEARLKLSEKENIQALQTDYHFMKVQESGTQYKNNMVTLKNQLPQMRSC